MRRLTTLDRRVRNLELRDAPPAEPPLVRWMTDAELDELLDPAGSAARDAEIFAAAARRRAADKGAAGPSR